jgi:hypothetical protein
MSDRWDEDEDELDRGHGRRRESELEPEAEPTLGEMIEGSVRKLVTGLVIAGGLIGLGAYGGGRASRASAGPDYQITTSADGRIVYRLDTDRGRIIACQSGGTHCWQVLQRGQELDEEPPAETPKQNAAAPQPAQPQVTAQPAAPQLTAPQNTQAPAPANR